MQRNSTSSAPRPSRRSWRSFPTRDGRVIERQMRQGRAPCCPGCGTVLEAQPSSRLLTSIPVALGAWAYDLDCRGCRKFWCFVMHSERSLQLMRMRRLAAAIKSARVAPGRSTVVNSPVAA